MELPLVQKGSIILLNKHNNVSFIEETLDKKDMALINNPTCIIKLNVSIDRAFNKHLSYSTGQILYTPKSDYIMCSVLDIETYETLPLFRCAWKTGRFLSDLQGIKW